MPSMVLRMQQLFRVVDRLHRLELYDDLCLFCELHLPTEPAKTFIEEDQLDEDQYGYLLCCLANACRKLGNYPQAIRHYEMALRYLGQIRQRKLKNRYEQVLNTAEIRLRMHKVLLENKQEEEALRCLKMVPRTELTPKILLAMARLCHQLAKMPSQSTRSLFNRRVDAPNARIVNYFKAIVKDVPEAVYCRSYLLSVGALKHPIQSPISDHNNKAQSPAADDQSQQEMTNCFVSAEARVWAEAKQLQAKKCFLQAAKLQDTVPNGQNLRILLEQARFYRIAGNLQKAQNCYQQAHLLDSTNAEGMDAYAALLGMSNTQQSQRELDLLAHKMLHSNPYRAESFVVYGWAVRHSHRVAEAKQLAQKAEQLAQKRGRQRCEALLLKAQLLFDTKRHYKDMEMVLADALHNDCTNTAIYALYIQMFMAQKRYAEAQRMAKTSMKFVGEQNHQIRFLFAQSLAEDPTGGGHSGTEQAIGVLEKMVEEEQQCLSLEPLLLLARLYDRQQKYEKAIELLNRFKESFGDARIHRELGDLLSKTNRSSEALNEYGQALSTSAPDSAAKERMINLMGGFTTPQCAINAAFESGSGAGAGGSHSTAAAGPPAEPRTRMPPPVARVTRRTAVNQHEQLRRLRGMGIMSATGSQGSSGTGTRVQMARRTGNRMQTLPYPSRISAISPVLAPLRFDEEQQQANRNGTTEEDSDSSESDSNDSQLSLDEASREDNDDGVVTNSPNGSSSLEQSRASTGSGRQAINRLVGDIQRYLDRNVTGTTTTTTNAESGSSGQARASRRSRSATPRRPTTTVQQQSIDRSDGEFVPLAADEPLAGQEQQEGMGDEEDEDTRMSIDNGQEEEEELAAALSDDEMN